jgi:hypothetical protein
MSEIDIRATDQNVKIIRFSSSSISNRAVKLVYLAGTSTAIQAPKGDLSKKALLIDSKEDAENMIKAIQHAIYLGWFDE